MIDNVNVMFLILGLGNPGEKYLKSRHNVGFILLDEILGDVFVYEKYSDADVFKDGDCIFAKPKTYMNNSGVSAKYLSQKNSIPFENIIVLHDDIDLPFGSVRLVFGSGAGGHNGVKSISENIGTNDFIRIKIGIAPTDEDGKAIKPKPGIFQSQKSAVANFVLKDFSKNDLEKLKSLSGKIKEIIDTIKTSGYLQAMNKFN